MTPGGARPVPLGSVRFEPCDPQEAPASELLAEMTHELNALYWTPGRLDVPPVHADELRPPDGIYLVAWQGARAVAGGAVRRMEADVGEIKRMFVRPAARSRGVAGALLAALETSARSLGYRRVRLDTGPRQVHAISLYQRAGYVPIDPYNQNPFASFWGEKELTPPPVLGRPAEPFVD
jgi:GNAT superfamily N-acetyltransferase